MMSQKRGPTPSKPDSKSKVLLKTPTPLRTITPSAHHGTTTIPHQPHIDDLVQKNRTLEHTIKKLKDELALEESRSKDAVEALQAKWREEMCEWNESFETVQGIFRIAHMNMRNDLEKERSTVLHEGVALNKERRKGLEKEYVITTLQGRVTELEFQVDELEEELDIWRSEGEDVQALTETIKELHTKNMLVESEVKDMIEELATAREEKKDAEENLRRLREELAQTAAKDASSTSKLERITLQRDMLQTRVDELKQVNEEHRRNNSELKRQIEKWESLENRGEAELDAVRKQKVELELQVKDIGRRLEDTEEKLQEQNAALEKERNKSEKLKDKLETWKEEADEHQEAAENSEKKLEDANRQLAKSQKQMEDLKAELQALRSNSKGSSSMPLFAQTPSEDEVEQVVTKSFMTSSADSRQQKKPKPPSTSNREGSSDVEEIRKPASRSRRAAPPDSDVEIVEQPARAKNKRKAQDEDAAPKPKRGRPRKPSTEVIEAEEVEELNIEKKRRGRPRRTTSEEVEEVVESKKGGKKAVVEIAKEDPPEKGKGKRTVSGKAKNALPTVQEEADSVSEEKTPPKKKKRKINIFPTTQPATFKWDQPGDGSGLNIPTELSPVKDTDMVPRRFGRISAGGSFAGPSYTRPR